MSVSLIEGPNFVQGETDTDVDYRATQDGEPFDLTGYTRVELYAVNMRTGVALAVINGTILSPATAGVFRINHDTITAVADADSWRCQFARVHPTNGTRRWPRDVRIPVRARVEDV